MHEILLSGHFKKMAVPILKRLVEKGTSILNMLKSDFVIEGQEIILSCPEGIQRWSIVFRCKKGLLPRGKKFACGDVKEIRLRSLMPLRDLTDIAIRILPGEGFKILYGPLTDYSLYLLEIDFGIENPRLIDNIVNRSVQLESPREEKQEYWMHAQLRFVDVLERFFSNFSIKDLNFNVDVAVHQDIKLAVPPYFKRELEIVVKWLESRDRELKRRLSV